MMLQAQYIWIDGAAPTRKLRSKRKVFLAPSEIRDGSRNNRLWLDYDEDPAWPAWSKMVQISDFPEWGFDGSSTGQADGDDSDCLLKPVAFVPDPIRGEGTFLVMCEVYNGDDTPHESNTRAKLREIIGVGLNANVAEGSEGAEMMGCWFGYEQEYTLMQSGRPLGWPENGYPAPQGPFYCGVGSDEVFGRDLVDEHAKACIDAGILITGTNAEVMPGQWEFQIGGPGSDPLKAADHLWLARWLLYRIGEDHGISATLDPKPVRGDWNGSGMHTNFSTAPMRRADSIVLGDVVGKEAIVAACEAIGEHVDGHLDVYGEGYEKRLTGQHETASYKEFKFGSADRTASIRIPRQVEIKGCGYLEDRRPNANADPYEVAGALLKSTFGRW